MKKVIFTIVASFAIIGFINAQGAKYTALKKPASVKIDSTVTDVPKIFDQLVGAKIKNFASVGVTAHLDSTQHYGMFYCMWDESNLYFLVDVYDATPISWKVGTSTNYLSTGFEIFTNFDDKHTDTSTKDNGADYHQNRFNLDRPILDQTGFDFSGADTADYRYSVVQTTYQLTYAFLIAYPWGNMRYGQDLTTKADIDAAVTAAIKPGKKISMDVSIIVDSVINGRQGLMQWSNHQGKDSDYYVSSVWGDLTLDGTTVGINNTSIKDNQFKVFPTVVNNDNIIQISNAVGVAAIYDIEGRFIKYIPANLKSVNVSDLTSGMYFVKNGTNTARFIKK